MPLSCQSLEDVLSAVTSPKPMLKRDADDRSYSYEVSWPHHSIFMGVVCLFVIGIKIIVFTGLLNTVSPVVLFAHRCTSLCQ
jgi:hypothetical protein